MDKFIKKPRGTDDLYGKDCEEFEYICRTIENLFISYGYSKIITPIFESVNVFAGNDEALLHANKEFFVLENRKEEVEDKLVLRPENTASIIRCIAENKLINKSNINDTLSYYYISPCFRYERPQKGRRRQFTQMGIEKINANSLLNDLENIELMDSVFRELGISEFVTLHVNYLGNKASKELWNKELSRYFEKFKEELSDISQTRIYKNPCRILDDKEDVGKDFVKKAPKIQDFLSKADRENIKFLREHIEEKYWDYLLTRGMDYYTGLVYEWKFEGLTIAAGGRYNELFKRFDYEEDFSCLGLAIGIERVAIALKKQLGEMKINPKKSVYVSFSSLNPNSLKIFKQVRENLDKSIVLKVNYEILNFVKHKRLSSPFKTFIFINWERKIVFNEDSETEFSDEKDLIEIFLKLINEV